MNYLITFLTQLDAVIAREMINKEKGICNLSPVPRCLSSSCGTCAVAKNIDLSFIKTLDYDQVFKIENEKYIRLV